MNEHHVFQSTCYLPTVQCYLQRCTAPNFVTLSMTHIASIRWLSVCLALPACTCPPCTQLSALAPPSASPSLWPHSTQVTMSHTTLLPSICPQKRRSVEHSRSLCCRSHAAALCIVQSYNMYVHAYGFLGHSCVCCCLGDKVEGGGSRR